MKRAAGVITVFALLCIAFISCKGKDENTVLVITGHPYSAQRTFTITRQLADGTSTREVQESIEWRDNQGRTRDEQIQHSPTGGEQRIINVSDPITRRHLAWTIGPRIEKEVFVTPMPGPIQFVNRIPGTDMTPEQRAQAIAKKRNPNATGERLGTAIINDVDATGLRAVIVIPAGTEGNEHELKRFSESWRATELGFIVRSIDEDPRTGLTDMEVTEINRSNPDPSRFEPPPGFRIQVVQP